MSSKLETLKELHKKYKLEKSNDFFDSPQGFTIITRSGIEKIQFIENISVDYEVVTCTPTFCCVKAIASSKGIEHPIQTFGSATFGEYKEEKKTDKRGKEYSKKTLLGSTNSYYVMEIAEKRSLARAILKVTGLYKFKVFSEDENEEDFTK